MNHWAYKYIGLKWVNGGRDIATGVDCWGLLRHVYKEHYKIELPLFNGVDAENNLSVSRMIDNNKNDWIEIKTPTEGCAVGLSKNKLLHHVGVFVCGVVVHADKMGVVAQSISALKLNGWSTLRFFRHTQYES